MVELVARRPYIPIEFHCASIVATSTLRVKRLFPDDKSDITLALTAANASAAPAVIRLMEHISLSSHHLSLSLSPLLPARHNKGKHARLGHGNRYMVLWT